jgi:hypothetical protein
MFSPSRVASLSFDYMNIFRQGYEENVKVCKPAYRIPEMTFTDKAHAWKFLRKLSASLKVKQVRYG